MRTALVGHEVRHIRRLAEVNLARAGWRVVTVATPGACVETAAHEQPDLIVLDAHWGAVAGELARDPRTCDLRVLTLSPPR